ncbi:DNA polymerase III subunit [Spongiivirga citrea]|uniref:DNA polymerase III subunit delta n=1 Tax=Spongiivirga citrea TaxID=1481457 RepID=A0A6M0CHQ1_9FLAO|nr:DNA polymerase III subunit delta' [Spongiivirga citrea]NER17395.1 DNA polymerase III subunit delta' [Spongiivirga citrea]
MMFAQVIGHDIVKKHLIKSVHNGRVPHAQMFVGPEGCGKLPLAIAYAQYLVCANTGDDNKGGKDNCNLMFKKFAHPDVHFSFPVTTTSAIKKDPKSADFNQEFLQFLKEEPYGNLLDWQRFMGVEKKQTIINVHEAKSVDHFLSMKPYEGGYKVVIMWMADTMNEAAANKLLKSIEEPPDNTVIILLAKSEENVIGTIRSRCQVIHLNGLPEVSITKELVNRGVPEMKANKIAHQSAGNFNKALDLVEGRSEDSMFEEWFITWVRNAFRAKGNKSVINDLVDWSESIATSGRQAQKEFLIYSTEVFRQAMLINYGVETLSYFDFEGNDFDLKKFAPFIHNGNIVELIAHLEEAVYHVQGNGNAKIILTDLSIKLTRLLHAKQ